VAVAQGQFENRGRGASAIGNRYQRTGEGTAGREYSVRAIVNCSLCGFAIASL
jgi:hypothetical protein